MRSYNTTDFISDTNGIHIAGAHIDSVEIMIIVLTAVLGYGLIQIIDRTTLGKSMRAVASDCEAAEMLGINVDRTIALTFFIGSVLAGFAGVMSGLEFQSISATIGFLAGLKAFTAPGRAGCCTSSIRDSRGGSDWRWRPSSASRSGC